jgi:hypothetical protein
MTKFHKKKKIYGLISGIVMSPLIVDISPLHLSSSYPEMTLKFSHSRAGTAHRFGAPEITPSF